jgi:hypothetical protein
MLGVAHGCSSALSTASTKITAVGLIDVDYLTPHPSKRGSALTAS